MTKITVRRRIEVDLSGIFEREGIEGLLKAIDQSFEQIKKQKRKEGDHDE